MLCAAGCQQTALYVFGPGWRGIAGDDLTLWPRPETPYSALRILPDPSERASTPPPGTGKLSPRVLLLNSRRRFAGGAHEQVGGSTPTLPSGHAPLRGREEMD